eukprot:NODE_17865_length_922_cov_4.810063.p2 GENE.NODE_17865_length_922_cov_4.810063~~NODE_17865_length_922_cov_4.810063.p2  ORF type:complete len:112 (+),score=25.17 NODE_17865_length_922_cov_4.810063:102-437(+)
MARPTALPVELKDEDCEDFDKISEAPCRESIPANLKGKEEDVELASVSNASYHAIMAMNSRQPLDFAEEQRAFWRSFDKGIFTVTEALALVDEFVDHSDPDVDISNSFDAF